MNVDVVDRSSPRVGWISTRWRVAGRVGGPALRSWRRRSREARGRPSRPRRRVRRLCASRCRSFVHEPAYGARADCERRRSTRAVRRSDGPRRSRRFGWRACLPSLRRRGGLPHWRFRRERYRVRSATPCAREDGSRRPNALPELLGAHALRGRMSSHRVDARRAKRVAVADRRDLLRLPSRLVSSRPRDLRADDTFGPGTARTRVRTMPAHSNGL